MTSKDIFLRVDHVLSELKKNGAQNALDITSDDFVGDGGIGGDSFTDYDLKPLHLTEEETALLRSVLEHALLESFTIFHDGLSPTSLCFNNHFFEQFPTERARVVLREIAKEQGFDIAAPLQR